MTIAYLKATAISDPDSNINSGTVIDIDEGVNYATPDGNFIGSVTNVWSGGKTWTIDVENAPVDFSSANSALVRVRALVGGVYVNDTLTWTASVTGTNAPTGSVSWNGSGDAGVGYQNKATTADTGVSGASSANIDGWQITIVQTGSTVKSADDLYFDLDGVEIELDYNASADTDITTNTPPSMTTTTYKPSIDYNLYPGSVAMTTTAYPATVSLDISITTGTPPAMSTTVYPATVALDRNVTTGTPPAMTVSVHNATVTVGVTIETNAPPAMVTTTYPVTLTLDRNVNAGVVAMTTTPHQASIALDIALTTGAPPSMTTTTYPVTFTFDRNVTTGAPPSLTTATYSQTVELFVGTNVFVNAPPAMTTVTYTQVVAGQRGVAAEGGGSSGLWNKTFTGTFN